MVVDPEQLDDFEPIRRGYNKRAFRAALGTSFGTSAVFFLLTAGWPLEHGMPWWGRLLYLLGGWAVVWTVYYFGGGILKGMIGFSAYYILVFCGYLFAGATVDGTGSFAYTSGIFTFLLYIPAGAVLGWTLQQGP